MKWSKMLTNLFANASAAILNMTAVEVYDHSGLFRMEIWILRAALVLIRALRLHGVDLLGAPVRALALAIKTPGFLTHPLLQKTIGGGAAG